MAVYEGARPRTIGLPRRPRARARVAGSPTLDRRRVRGAFRAGRRTNRLGLVLGAIVVAFMLAFFSLAQQVRVSATGLDIGRLELERQRLDDAAADVRSDLNRLGREPAIRKLGDRRRSRAAGRTARPPAALGDRPTDAGPDRFPQPPARSCSSSSCIGSLALTAQARATGRSSIVSGWPARRSPRRRSPSRRRASAATSTTGPGPSSWPRPSSANGSSRPPTS